MKTLNRVLCAGIAASMVVSVMPTTVFAEETPVSSPAELIIDMVEMATVDIESSTLQAAYDTVEGLVTVNSDQVYYDGISIGYWYADAPTNIYKDAERTSTALTLTDGAYIVDPVLLSNIMNDFNNQLVESYVPTTADWSKIIGKYDVTLGSIELPADMWIDLTPCDDPTLESDTLINISQMFDTHMNEVNTFTAVQAYIVGDDGMLYMGDSVSGLWSQSNFGVMYRDASIWGTTVTNGTAYVYNDSNAKVITYGSSQTWYHYAGLQLIDGVPTLRQYVGNLARSPIHVAPYAETASTYYNITDPSKKWTPEVGIKCVGVIPYYQCTSGGKEATPPIGTINSLCNGTQNFLTANQAKLQGMWTSQSSSKVVNGNTQLTQRLSKLAQLELTDTISLTADGWSVNGTEDLDFYVGATSMSEAGSTTDIAALADVEAMVFNVVVPSTLPIYVDEYGKVSVADNAIVQNLSCASVVITEVKINESQSGDWTLVDANPSPNRDANEFTFTTTLREGIVLAKDEVLSFTYGAELSPVTSGAVALDLATVSVTVDWAPVGNP